MDRTKEPSSVVAMAPLRTVETLDQIAARIEDGGRKLKKPDRRVLNALQTFDLTELVGSMMNIAPCINIKPIPASGGRSNM